MPKRLPEFLVIPLPKLLFTILLHFSFISVVTSLPSPSYPEDHVLLPHPYTGIEVLVLQLHSFHVYFWINFPVTSMIVRYTFCEAQSASAELSAKNPSLATSLLIAASSLCGNFAAGGLHNRQPLCFFRLELWSACSRFFPLPLFLYSVSLSLVK